MIRTPTTFVVGAGASWSYRLPTAGDLKQTASGMGADSKIFQLVIRHARPTIEIDQLERFLDDLRDHPATSIDAYLQNRHHYVDTAMPIGKALIAALLGEQIQQNPRPAALANDDWLGYVVERMSEGAATWPEFRDGNQHVRFVTFNFDSIIEDRLWRDIKRIHPPAPDHEILDMLQRGVIHVHGRLPTVPALELHDSPTVGFHQEWQRWIVEAAPTVTVVAEEIGEDKLRDAREAVRQARVLCFLGFHYAVENLERLDLRNWLMTTGALHVHGTAYERADGEQLLIRHRLNNRIELGGRRLRCRELLREHFIFRD
jgi:hypothetical protein